MRTSSARAPHRLLPGRLGSLPLRQKFRFFGGELLVVQRTAVVQRRELIESALAFYGTPSQSPNNTLDSPAPMASRRWGER
jgi:hypothetical protein